MFDVVLNDGREMPESDIYYIIAKEGIFLKKNMGIMDSIAPVKNISILESIKASAKMNIEKIPGASIAKVHSFFREVYRQYRSEAIVLLFYNEETGEHKIVPPTQKVSGAACDYDKGISIDGYTMIGTIHSHGSMSAFHSGTDDDDESHFDGLHITLGHLNDDFPSISASIVANGFRVVVEPNEYIEDVILAEESNVVDKKKVTTTYKIENDKVVIDDVKEMPYYTTYFRNGGFDRRYFINVEDSEREFNEKWMDLVTRAVYTYSPSRFVGGRGNRGGYWNGWGDNFDPYAWRREGKHLPGVVIPKTSSTSAKTSTKKESDILSDVDGNKIPCASCKHRDCKLIDEMNDEVYEEYYVCKKCNTVVIEEEDTILQCLGCMSDEYLVLLDDDNLLTENYEKSGGNQPSIFDAFTDDPETESDYIRCDVCTNVYHAPDEDTRCPFCLTIAYGEIDDSEVYRGTSLYDEEEAANQAALQEALGNENPVTRIQEPDSDSIPIPEKKDDSLIAKFRQVFGGGK